MTIVYYLVLLTTAITTAVIVVVVRLGFKTSLSKTKTKTQQFQDQDFDVQDRDRDSRLTRPILEVHNSDGLWQTKRLKKSRQAKKPSIPVVAHSKQRNIIPCLTWSSWISSESRVWGVVPGPKTKTETETRGFQDQDQDSEVQDQDGEQDL